MKRILALVLALSMTALLFGCGAQEAPEAAPTEIPTEGPTLVTNVDDLLAAIAPGAEILLGEGTFNLSAAANYGKSDNPYYTWDSLGGNDFLLVIQNVEGMTIRGCGQDSTNLVTSLRLADVVKLRSCKDVTIEDMTIGHTEMTEACEGGVVYLDHSSGITLNRLGLYGCGTLGVQAYSSEAVTIQECEVYDCSIGGISFSGSRDLTVNSCTFHSLGKDQPVSNVFSFWNSENITVSNCMISSNYVNNLLFGEPNSTVTFRDNQFVGNAIAEAAFSLWSEGLVMEGNVFENNTLRNWYATASYPALDLEGKELTFEDPNAKTPPAPGVASSVSTGEQKEVRVSTADDFIKAIAPDTCIILDAELIDFSTASGYQGALKEFEKTSDFMPSFTDPSNSYCYWVDNFDGPSLVITGVNNLTIQAEGEDREAHTLSAVPRYADVLTFEQCSAITLSGFTAGHTIERGSCTGGVFLFQNSEKILVENCGMYGCGTEGFNGEFSRDIQIINSEIYECSVAGIELSNCENVAIAGTIIRDIESEWGAGNFFRFYGNKNVTLDGEPLDGNYHGN